MTFLRRIIVGMITVGRPSRRERLGVKTLKDSCGLTKEQAKELNGLFYGQRLSATTTSTVLSVLTSSESDEGGDVDLLEAQDELPPTSPTADDQFNYDEAPSPAASHRADQVPLPVSSLSTSQPPVHLMTSAPETHSETPDIRSEQHNDSAPPSRFLRILGRWKKSVRKPAVPEPRRLVENVNVSNRVFSTMAEGRSQPRTVRRIVEPKKKKSKARPRAGGGQDGSTGTGGHPPNTGPSSEVALPPKVDHGGGTSTGGRPLDAQPSCGTQQAKYGDQPSVWGIDLRQEPGKAIFSITFPTWLCCCSSGTKEQ